MAQVEFNPTGDGKECTYYECKCGELSSTQRCEFCGEFIKKKCVSRPVTGTGPA